MIDWKEKGGEAIREVFEVCRLESKWSAAKVFFASGSPPSGLRAMPPLSC